jgi:cyclopropane-fatty-acyl-phospholipid synthase
MLAQLPPVLQSLDIPLRVKLWDGNQFDLGPARRSPSWSRTPADRPVDPPNLEALGSAFVEGKLELEGDIGEVIRVCDELSQTLLKDEDDVLPQRTSHDKSTDAEAISYHYDLSNAFYQLWLDPDMVYSCAYFKEPDNTLDQAQQDKFDHLCRKLRLQAGDYLLDVGCGWGGLARFAAREYGAKVYGITLSKEQLKLGRQRVKEGWPTRSTCTFSITATCPRMAASTRWSASACSSTSATPTSNCIAASCSVRCAKAGW